ncbi:MAG TPA: hypothetical protein VMS98_10485 [Thermoanaerobaculia bacterium]|nr:hypothetical protein [Thermoanaerobaculia bacterium]
MRWASWIIVVLAMHFIWEMAQAKWFSSMAGLPFWSATLLCLRASIGDVAITLAAFFAAAAVAKRVAWPLDDVRAAPTVVYLMAGLATTIVIELLALHSGRWSYAPDMPVVFGIGVLPLAQWIVLPLIALGAFRLMWKAGDLRFPGQ